MRTPTAFASIALFSAILSGPVIAQTKEPVKIAVILPLSGPFAQYGARIKSSLVRHQREGTSFAFEDEGCDPKIAVNAFKKLSSADGLKLFLGPWCGSPQQAIAPLLKQTGSVAVLGSSAPASIFADSGGRMFSTQHTIESESAFLAQKMNEMGIGSVAIVFRENQFSRTHEAAFRAKFSGKISDTFAYTSGDVSELRSIALRIRILDPQALYIPDASPLLGGLLKELRVLGVPQKRIFSVFSIQSEDVLKSVGNDGDGVVYSYPDIDGDAFDHFPGVASATLTSTARTCAGDTECVVSTLSADPRFGKEGTLQGGFVLKAIKNGAFVRAQ